MSLYIQIRDVINSHFGSADCKYAEDYLFFRTIEDWCTANIHKDRWKFDHSSTISLCGVDVPGRISFWHRADMVAFKLKFNT